MIRSLLCAAVLIPAVFGAVAANAQERDAPYVNLSYADTDFNNSSQVERLYNRLKAAARNVCEDETLMASIANPDADRVCRDKALAAAVRDINRSQLTWLAGADSREAPVLAMNATMEKRAR